MRKFRTNLIGVEQGSEILFSDFEDDGVMWTGTGPRNIRRDIRFSQTFAAPPVVQVSMSMWDLDQETNPRADISATDISQSGFVIVFKTWGDTRVARVRADWLAIGELSDDELWDVD